MFRRMLREYLSLTRGERRGLKILSLLVVLLVVFRGSLPRLIHPAEPDLTRPGKDFIAFHDSLEKLDALMALNRAPVAGNGKHAVRYGSPGYDRRSPELFPFDPNQVEFDDLIRLGVSGGTARILLNYRKAGGRFDSDSDLLRIYGLHPDEFRRLQPYIRILHPGRSHDADTPAYGVSTAQHPYRSQITLSNTHEPFELNAADSQQLVSVYGIGPIFARRIIRYRELLGGFYRREQLLEVYGLSLQQYEELSRSSVLDTGLLRKIDLNSLDAGDISLHPYLDRYQAAALVAYREQMGAFKNPAEVVENRLVPDSVYRKIRPYLELDR